MILFMPNDINVYSNNIMVTLDVQTYKFTGIGFLNERKAHSKKITLSLLLFLLSLLSIFLAGVSKGRFRPCFLIMNEKLRKI